MRLSNASTAWWCFIETAKEYKDYFLNDKVLFLNSSITYEEFWAFVAERKLPEAKYIGLFCDSIDSLITYMAIVAAQKVAVLLDPSLTEDEVKKREEIFSSNNDTFALYQEDNCISYKNYSPLKINKNATNTIIFTSGSTSNPKPIELCFENFYESTLASSKHYNIKETDCWAMSLSFYHIGGLMIFYRTIFNQLSTVFLKPNDYERHIIDFPEITILSLVELQLTKIFKKAETIQRAQELKGIVLGGMKTSLKTINEACRHEIYLSNSYGQTETCSQICATDFCIDPTILLTSGVPLGKNQIKILENNQIEISSKSIANGIYPDIQFNSKLLTNDIGEIDKYRYLTVHGRIDDIIISGGKKISPQKITQALYDTDLEIIFAQTFAVTDEKYSQRPASIISCKEIIDEQIIKNELEGSSLSRFELPKFVIQISNLDNLKSGIKISSSKCKALLERVSPFYEILGAPTIRGNIDGEWLFIFHGFMGSAKDFFFLNSTLEDKYLIFFVNLPGHCKKNLKQEITFDKYCDDILNNLYKQNQKISVLGYSLGGRFASVLCSRSKKDTIKTLLLESSGLGIKESQKQMRQIQDKNLLSNIQNKNDFREFLLKWYEQAIFKGIKDSHEDFNEALNKDSTLLEGFKTSLNFHGQAVMPNIKAQDLKEKCSKIVYIYGEYDLKYELIATQMEIAGIDIAQIKNTGHICHLRSNNRYLEVIMTYLLK